MTNWQICIKLYIFRSQLCQTKQKEEIEPSNALEHRDRIEPDETEPCNELETQYQTKQDEIEQTQDEINDQPQLPHCNSVAPPEQDIEETPPNEVDQPDDIEPECETSSPMDVVGMLYEKVGKFVNKICSSPDNEHKIHKIVSLFLADSKNTFKTTN